MLVPIGANYAHYQPMRCETCIQLLTISRRSVIVRTKTVFSEISGQRVYCETSRHILRAEHILIRSCQVALVRPVFEASVFLSIEPYHVVEVGFRGESSCRHCMPGRFETRVCVGKSLDPNVPAGCRFG